MRLNSIPRWLGCRRNWITSPFWQRAASPAPVTRSTRLNPSEFALASPRAEIRLVLGSLVVDIVWLAIWSFVAVRYHAPFAIVLASLPVLKWSLLVVARHPRGDRPCEQPASLAAPAESNAALRPSPAAGRSRPGSPEPRLASFRDPRLAGDTTTGPGRDWIAVNGSHYRIQGRWLPPRRSVSPFGTVPDWWRVYQIAVEDPQGRVGYGWVRLGDGALEFRLEVDRPRREWAAGSQHAGGAAEEFPSGEMPVLASAEPLVHPMA